MRNSAKKSNPSLERTNDVRVAAVLGKTHAARRLHPEEIAADAIQLSQVAQLARTAVLAKKPIDKLALKAREIAGRYNAELVAECDPKGIVFGLDFMDGSFADMGRGIFRIC